MGVTLHDRTGNTKKNSKEAHNEYLQFQKEN